MLSHIMGNIAIFQYFSERYFTLQVGGPIALSALFKMFSIPTIAKATIVKLKLQSCELLQSKTLFLPIV